MAMTLRTVAELAVMIGVALAASMAVFRLALRVVDWSLLPSSALPRVRWWSAHAIIALRAGLLIGIVGLLGLALG